MPRRSSSSVIFFIVGSPDRGLSTSRIGGGKGGGLETEVVSASGGTVSGGLGMEDGEGY